MLKSYFWSQFYTSKIIWIFQFFYSRHFLLENINLVVQFLLLFYWHFLVTSVFETLYFLKWCPIFDGSTLCLFTKHNDFLQVFWFVAKNIVNFSSLSWKLDNPNCHVDCWVLTTRGQNGYSLVTIYLPDIHTKKHFTGQLCLFWSHFPKNFATKWSTCLYSLSSLAFP